MPSTPEDAIVSMKANLEEKTGKKWPEWLAIARATGLAKHGEIVAHLKKEHALGHGYANMIALEARQGDAPKAESGDAVAEIYSGAKAGLRPIHDALMAAIGKLGSDFELSPKKGYVSLRRKKQFALIQPSTATRLDLGLQLKGVAPEGRLEAAGSWNAMVSHRVRLESAKEVDKELAAWLKAAFEAAG
jgi:hypothetical protein